MDGRELQVLTQIIWYKVQVEMQMGAPLLLPECLKDHEKNWKQRKGRHASLIWHHNHFYIHQILSGIESIKKSIIMMYKTFKTKDWDSQCARAASFIYFLLPLFHFETFHLSTLFSLIKSYLNRSEELHINHSRITLSSNIIP